MAENSVCLVLVIVNVLLQGVDESPLVMKYVRTEVGGNVTLDCGDEGKAKEGVDWFRSTPHSCSEQKVISENGTEFVLCERLSKNKEILKPELKGRLSIANEEVSSSLTITNIEDKDQGTYFCVRSDQTRVLSTSVLYIIPEPTALTVDSSASSHLSPSSSSSKEDSDPDPDPAAPLALTSSRLPPSMMSSVVIAISFFVFVFLFFAFTSKFIYRRRKRCSSAKEDADCSNSSAASDTISVSIDKVSVASDQDFSVYHVLRAEDNSIRGSSERIEPRPSVAAGGAFDDGIIYAELKASAEAGNLIISSSQPIENLFHRSIYAQIDHGIETAQRPT